MSIGSEEGSYLRPHRLLYHSTLGWRVIKKRRRRLGPGSAQLCSGPRARMMRVQRERDTSYLWLVDSYITQLKAEGRSRTCNESKEEEKKKSATPNARPPNLSCESAVEQYGTYKTVKARLLSWL